MKKIILIIIGFVLVSCSKNENSIKEKVFPLQVNSDSTRVISLDTIKNIKHLESVICKEDKKTFIRVNQKDMFIYFPCKIKGCFWPINVIRVKDKVEISDTILNFNVENYKKLLKKQFFNKGKNPFLSNNPKRIFTVVYSKKEIDFKGKLDTISESYISFIKDFNLKNIDSLKRSYPLHLSLMEIIPPPPPPPMPKEKND